MARKKGPTQERRKRGKQINVRVSDTEYEAFRAMAEELDLPLTTWIRLVCRRAAKLETP